MFFVGLLWGFMTGVAVGIVAGFSLARRMFEPRIARLDAELRGEWEKSFRGH